jgi:hypothetical protein
MANRQTTRQEDEAVAENDLRGNGDDDDDDEGAASQEDKDDDNTDVHGVAERLEETSVTA